jgi:hypothetical protein
VTEKDNLALVRRPPSALEGGVPAAKRIVTLMVTETLALAQGKAQVQSLSSLQPYTRAELESWNQKGESHRWGRGVPQDSAQAVHWYRKAAEQGHEFAQHDLGLCYEEGEGILKNAVVACVWLRLAAEQGLVRAKVRFAALSAMMSPNELAESERLYEEYSKRKQS